MVRKKLGTDSDNEDESRDNEKEKVSDQKKGGLTRSKAKLRFVQGDDEESDEETVPDWKKKREIQAQKLLDAKLEEEAAAAKAEEEETAKEEGGIEEEGRQKDGADDDDAVSAPAQTEDSALQRNRKSKSRFDEGEDGDTTGTDQALQASAAKVTVQASLIPWIPVARRLEEEGKIFFCVQDDRKADVSRRARESMRKQGLYVSKESDLLSKNVERALQRSRVHRAAESIQASLVGDVQRWRCFGSASSIKSAAALLKDGAYAPFDDAEKLYVVPFEPLKDRICRPVMRYDPSQPYMQYSVAIPVTNLDAVLGPSEKSTVVDLEISGLTLTDHPLFIEEDYLACEITGLYRKYKRRAEANWVNFCTQKLETLQLALENLRKEQGLIIRTNGANNVNGRLDLNKTGKQDQEQGIQEEIRRVRLQRAQEEMDDLSVISRMIQVWDRLKLVRKEQGFVSTKIDLKFKQRKTDPDEDKKLRQEELEAELGEMEQKHLAESEARLSKLKKEKQNLIKLVDAAQKRVDALISLERQASQTQDSEGSSDEDDDDDGDEFGEKRQSKKQAKAPAEVKSVDLLASAQIMRQRMEEEEKLKAAQELLSRHAQLEAAAVAIPFDSATARAAILARQEVTKRPIGSPIYEPIYREDRQRTEISALPATAEGAREKKRRDRIKAIQLIVRILVNGRLLRRPDGLSPLNVNLSSRDASFQFQACEVVQLLSSTGVPEIVLQVYEEGRISSTEIATTRIPPSVDLLDDRGDPIAFQGLKAWGVNLALQEADLKSGTKAMGSSGEDGVKSFVPLKQHFYTGEIFVRLHLPDSVDDPELRPTASKYGLSGGGIVSASKLKSMIQLNQIDPNDPRNCHLLEVLNSSKDIENDTLLFDPLQYNMFLGEQIKFTTRYGQIRVETKKKMIGEQILTCPATMRHKLLMARDKGTIFGRPYWPECAIPLFEKEVEEWHWDDFFDKVYPMDIPHEEVEEVPIEKRNKEKILKFQQKVQEQFRKARAKQAGGTRRKYKLRDVVHQPEIPELRPFAIMEHIKYLFRKRSTLRPEQKQIRVAERMPSQCNIRITVQRAYNLPQRRKELSASRASGESSAPGDGEILECVVQARFQNQETSTPVFKGGSPAWNAPLNLPFQPPGNDWSPAKLLKVTDCLHLNVFDTKVWEKTDNQGSLRKVEKRWLGSLKLPFATILNSACCRIDGLFELDAPPHTIGYTKPPPPAISKGANKGTPTDGSHADRLSSGKIQVCIALDPPLQQPGGGISELKGRVDDKLLDQRICSWINECKSRSGSRGRSFDALARCLKRDWVLITRYLEKCAPPDDAYTPGVEREKQMQQLCRFVSLIPFLEDWHLEDDAADDDIPSVWCTSREFVVDVGAGDWEEHATLLCNFFLFLGVDAYLVFGSGIPEGKTVYVMTLDGGTATFWNAVKGKRYECSNSVCTLKDIWYVVNSRNVWGNLQPARALGDLSFALEDAACWCPLFTAKLRMDALVSTPQQCQTVQVGLDWRRSPPREAEAQRIGKEFRSTIRTVLEHWRSKEGRAMIDNEAVSRRLGEILIKMEQAAHNEKPFTEEDLHRELENYLSSYHITGFYINRPFTEIDGILEEIHYSDIHRCGPVQNELNERDTQFSHAVYVKAFSRKIYSVWVAVACLSKKR